MSLIVCLNAVNLKKYAMEDIVPGKNSLDLVGAAMSGLEGLSKLLVLYKEQEGELSAESVYQRVASAIGNRAVELVRLGLPSDSVRDAAAGIRSVCADSDTVIFVDADAPFVNPGLTLAMLEKHRKWHAEYSFGDGFPLGYAPQIFQATVLQSIEALAARQPETLRISDREAWFETIKGDINAFEIETEISPVDLRLLRINLHTDTKQNFLLCRNLAEKADGPMEEFLVQLKERQEKLRTIPSYFNIQISGACPQVCSYCPWGQKGGSILSNKSFMPLETFVSLARKIREFAPESVVSISTWGEPSVHPQIWKIIEEFENLAPLSLYVETSGLGWDLARLEDFSKSEAASRVTWIVSLDSVDPVAYAEMRGEGHAEAMRAAHAFVRFFPDRAYIQAVRTRTNEAQMQSHYDYWKKAGAKQIIQKYDNFSRRLPDLRVSDISPLERHACWHLKRDFTVLLDGSVVPCREDFEASETMGNAFSENLPDIWSRIEGWYLRQLRGDYPKLCEHCDEYYTFNV